MARKPRGGVVLEDGPGAGRYSIARAPWFLRAVVSRVDGKVDLLDQLTDEPHEDEAVHVYEAVAGTLFTLAAGIIVCPPVSASGTYRHRPDVDGERLRTADAWRAWARSQPAPVPLVDGLTAEPHTGPLTPVIAIDGEPVDVRGYAPVAGRAAAAPGETAVGAPGGMSRLAGPSGGTEA
jgi:hypothetical protein